MRKLGRKKGFTLVELSLSIAFIAILSITVALIINDAISTYRRGVVLNQVNTVGMDLVDDMRAAIQSSSASSVLGECDMNYAGSNLSDERSACKTDGARNFVVVKRLAAVKGVGDNVPVYGAFCTGAYSYIWNSGYFYTDGMISSDISKATLKYDGSDGEVAQNDFKLLKIKDRRRAVCIAALNSASVEKYPAGASIDISSEFDITKYGAISDDPEILLSSNSANSLALYDLDAAAPATNDLQSATYYSVSFILGTVQGGINVMSTGNFCKTPGDYDPDGLENFDYCAINKFNFAAQAIGG